jgi:hypothetical protein
MTVAAEWGLGEVFLTMLYFSLFFIWIWIVVTVFVDIFRSQDIGGWGKAAWCLFVIVLPYIGVFTYLIARGRGMSERAMDEQRRRAAMFYSAAPPAPAAAAPSSVDQLSTLVTMKEQGVIDDDEFARMKAKVTV